MKSYSRRFARLPPCLSLAWRLDYALCRDRSKIDIVLRQMIPKDDRCIEKHESRKVEVVCGSDTKWIDEQVEDDHRAYRVSNPIII